MARSLRLETVFYVFKGRGWGPYSFKNEHTITDCFGLQLLDYELSGMWFQPFKDKSHILWPIREVFTTILCNVSVTE